MDLSAGRPPRSRQADCKTPSPFGAQSALRRWSAPGGLVAVKLHAVLVIAVCKLANSISTYRHSAFNFASWLACYIQAPDPNVSLLTISAKSEGVMLRADIAVLEQRQKVLTKEIDEALSHAPIDVPMIAYLKSRILYVKEEIDRLRHEVFISYH